MDVAYECAFEWSSSQLSCVNRLQLLHWWMQCMRGGLSDRTKIHLQSSSVAFVAYFSVARCIVVHTQALVRMGLLTVNLDSPMHSRWTNTKHCNAKTKRPCQVCNVPLDDLGDPNVDLARHRRTADGLQQDLIDVANLPEGPERVDLGKDRGVVPGNFPNPLDLVAFDRVEHIGIDMLHQVSLRISASYFHCFNAPDRGFIYCSHLYVCCRVIVYSPSNRWWGDE